MRYLCLLLLLLVSCGGPVDMHVLAIVKWGPSNNWNDGEGETGTYATVTWSYDVNGGATTSGGVIDLSGPFGDNLTFGRELHERTGWPIHIINVTRGSSDMKDWAIDETAPIITATTTGLEDMVAYFPAGTTFQFVSYGNTGSGDMRVDNVPFQENFSVYYRQWIDDILSPTIEAVMGRPYPITELLVQQPQLDPNAEHVPLIAREIVTSVGGSNPSDPSLFGTTARCVEAGMTADYLQPDLTHRNTAGYILLGEVGAQVFEQVITMTISHGTTTRTAVADLVVDRLDAGAGAGKVIIRDGTDVLATVTLADPAGAGAVAGAAALLGVPLDDVATGAGDADNFLAQDSDSNTVFAGSVTATGGGGDLTLDTVTIAVDDVVTITGGSYTAPP